MGTRSSLRLVIVMTAVPGLPRSTWPIAATCGSVMMVGLISDCTLSTIWQLARLGVWVTMAQTNVAMRDERMAERVRRARGRAKTQ